MEYSHSSHCLPILRFTTLFRQITKLTPLHQIHLPNLDNNQYYYNSSELLTLGLKKDFHKYQHTHEQLSILLNAFYLSLFQVQKYGLSLRRPVQGQLEIFLS